VRVVKLAIGGVSGRGLRPLLLEVEILAIYTNSDTYHFQVIGSTLSEFPCDLCMILMARKYTIMLCTA